MKTNPRHSVNLQKAIEKAIKKAMARVKAKKPEFKKTLLLPQNSCHKTKGCKTPLGLLRQSSYSKAENLGYGIYDSGLFFLLRQITVYQGFFNRLFP